MGRSTSVVMIGAVAMVAAIVVVSCRRDAQDNPDREAMEVGRILDENQKALEDALDDLTSANETMQEIVEYKPVAGGLPIVFGDDDDTPTPTTGFATRSMIGFSTAPSRDAMLFFEDGRWEWTSADGAVVLSGTNTRVPLFSEHTPCGHSGTGLDTHPLNCANWRTVPPTEVELRSWMEEAK